MRRSVISLTVILAMIFPSVCFAAGPAKPQGTYTSAVDDLSVWPDDLSAKIDKTIQVLTVIKTEVKKMEAADKRSANASPKGSTDAEREEIEKLRVKLGAMIRIWKKTDKIMQEDASKAAKQGTYTTDTAVDDAAKQLSNKIDTMIKAMEVIKEELDAADEPAAKKK